MLISVMNAFFSSQFGYCPLVWMFHNRIFYNKINTKGCLEKFTKIFAELFSEDKSFNIHYRNVQKLAIEIYKVKK